MGPSAAWFYEDQPSPPPQQQQQQFGYYTPTAALWPHAFLPTNIDNFPSTNTQHNSIMQKALTYSPSTRDIPPENGPYLTPRRYQSTCQSISRSIS